MKSIAPRSSPYVLSCLQLNGQFTNDNCECCEQVKTLELGSADLEKYHQALDKALVTYHAEKMQEVNEIAKFLWGQVR